MFSVKSVVAVLAAAIFAQATASNNTGIAKRGNPGVPTTSQQYPSHIIDFCSGINLGGSCYSWTFPDNQCMEVPAGNNDNIGSFYPLPTTTQECWVYADPYCSGTYYRIFPWGEMDVVGNGFFGSNGVTNIKCVQLNGVTAPTSMSSWNMRYCHGPIANGDCYNQITAVSTCTEVPQGSGFANTPLTFDIPSGAFCQLYTGNLCLGTQTVILSSNAVWKGNPNNNVVTFRCLYGTPS